MHDVLYNDNDRFAAEWLRRLVDAGMIESGEVDDTTIAELRPERVRGLRQFHAFAGIGAWSLALRLAGWPREQRVWTGSCPCQPFSQAGRGRGVEDERHLWPVWKDLIAACQPPVILGEQVASPDGRTWLGSVQADLEALGYLVVAADLCAAGVGAPHQRQRLYFAGIRLDWLEDPDQERRAGFGLQLQPGRPQQAVLEAPRRGEACGMGYSDRERTGWDSRAVPGAQEESASQRSVPGNLSNRDRLSGRSRRVADPYRQGLEHGPESFGRRLASSPGDGITRGHWADADWILCRDGKARAVEPETFPLAHGNADRVAIRLPTEQAAPEVQEEEAIHWYNRRGALRGFGNAIVPQVAAVFVQSVMDVIELSTGG